MSARRSTRRVTRRVCSRRRVCSTCSTLSLTREVTRRVCSTCLLDVLDVCAHLGRQSRSPLDRQACHPRPSRRSNFLSRRCLALRIGHFGSKCSGIGKSDITKQSTGYPQVCSANSPAKSISTKHSLFSPNCPKNTPTPSFQPPFTPPPHFSKKKRPGSYFLPFRPIEFPYGYLFAPPRARISSHSPPSPTRPPPAGPQ